MKKILIFSSYGGGGHISATDALKDYLENDYEIMTSYIYDDVLGCLDPVRILSFKKLNGEKLYNFFLRQKWTWLINKLYQIAALSLYFNEKILKKYVTNYLMIHKPDLVISVVPLVNDIIKNSCKECNIPFLLVPTDLDSTSFVKMIKPPHYDKFRLSLPFENSDINSFINKGDIPNQSRVLTGFPIKKSFFNLKNCDQIKQDFSVPHNKPVILVLMGAAGSNALYYYLITLMQLKFPVHLLLCLGRNESLRADIDNIARPKHISITIISYTHRIADLMSISKICITKAGTVSTCEALYMNVPIILDNTSTPLIWEKFNIDFIKKHDFGAIITHYNQLNSLVNKMMTDQQYYNTCKKNLEEFPKKQFGDCIKDVVSNLIIEQPHAYKQNVTT